MSQITLNPHLFYLLPAGFYLILLMIYLLRNFFSRFAFISVRFTAFFAVLCIFPFIMYAQSPPEALNPDTGTSYKKTLKQFVVVLDAGHGGNATGANGKFSLEKNITLAITLRLGKLIQQNCPDVKVIFTRTTDESVGLNERAEIANQNHANLFLCIHCNAVRKHQASPPGAETYVLGLTDVSRNLEAAIRENSDITKEANYKETYGGFDPYSPESYIIFSMQQGRNLHKSLRIANFIQAQFYKNNRVDRGVKQEPLLVLRNTHMPGVLIETGYISNPEEEEYLNSDDGQQTLAKSIFDAFLQYKTEVAK